MGIKGLLPELAGAVTRIKGLDQLKRQCGGKVAGIDGHSWIHMRLATIGHQIALNDGQGHQEIVSYFMERIDFLLESKIIPLVVFDGMSLPAKKLTNEKREQQRLSARRESESLMLSDQVKARRRLQASVPVTQQMVRNVILNLRSAGIAFLVAPFEADAQLSYLFQQRVIDFAIAEDSDLIVFGVRKVLFKLKRSPVEGDFFDSSHLRKQLQDDDFMRKVCILSGCDYLPNIPGLGLQTAIRFMTIVKNSHKYTAESFPKFLKQLPVTMNKRTMIVTSEYIRNFLTAEYCFKHQLVYCPSRCHFVPLTPYQADESLLRSGKSSSLSSGDGSQKSNDDDIRVLREDGNSGSFSQSPVPSPLPSSSSFSSVSESYDSGFSSSCSSPSLGTDAERRKECGFRLSSEELEFQHSLGNVNSKSLKVYDNDDFEPSPRDWLSGTKVRDLGRFLLRNGRKRLPYILQQEEEEGEREENSEEPEEGQREEESDRQEKVGAEAADDEIVLLEEREVTGASRVPSVSIDGKNRDTSHFSLYFPSNGHDFHGHDVSCSSEPLPSEPAAATAAPADQSDSRLFLCQESVSQASEEHFSPDAPNSHVLHVETPLTPKAGSAVKAVVTSSAGSAVRTALKKERRTSVLSLETTPTHCRKRNSSPLRPDDSPAGEGKAQQKPSSSSLSSPRSAIKRKAIEDWLMRSKECSGGHGSQAKPQTTAGLVSKISDSRLDSQYFSPSFPSQTEAGVKRRRSSTLSPCPAPVTPVSASWRLPTVPLSPASFLPSTRGSGSLSLVRHRLPHRSLSQPPPQQKQLSRHQQLADGRRRAGVGVDSSPSPLQTRSSSSHNCRQQQLSLPFDWRHRSAGEAAGRTAALPSKGPPAVELNHQIQPHARSLVPRSLKATHRSLRLPTSSSPAAVTSASQSLATHTLTDKQSLTQVLSLMAPPAEAKDGLLSDNNSIPLCKIPIEKVRDVTEDFEVESKPFARGKFATVKHCVHKTTRSSYAAKVIKKRRRCQDVSHEILHEARVLLLSAPCDRIVQLEKIYESSHDYILILELAAGGELQAVLDREEFLSESTSRHVMKQVLEGISFLHDHQIAHLDIKPQNILLTRPLPCCDVKICDFGISRVISAGFDLREIIGTPDYVAPEILNYEPISLATDMWSIGCLSYVLLSGCSPFGADDKQETFCNITSASLEFPVDVFGEVSEQAIDFIKRLIVKEPKKRLTCSEALRQDWLSSGSGTCNQKTLVSSTGTVSTISPAIVACNNNNSTHTSSNNNNNHNTSNHHNNAIVSDDDDNNSRSNVLISLSPPSPSPSPLLISPNGDTVPNSPSIDHLRTSDGEEEEEEDDALSSASSTTSSTS